MLLMMNHVPPPNLSSKEPPGKFEFTYVYKCLFSKLKLTLPFTTFEYNMLIILNLAHTQLHLDNWTFICAFKILGNYLNIIPTPNKFMYFYQLKLNLGTKSGWISLNGTKTKAYLLCITNVGKDSSLTYFVV